MSYGFEITDDAGLVMNDDIMTFTLIGTKTVIDDGAFKYTFPLESPPDFLYQSFFLMTDSLTTDLIVPVWHLNTFPFALSSSALGIENTAGLCLIGADLDLTKTNETDCTTAGGTWDTTTPYYAYFEGEFEYKMIGKDRDNAACFTGALDYATLAAASSLTNYFYSAGYKV